MKLDMLVVIAFNIANVINACLMTYAVFSGNTDASRGFVIDMPVQKFTTTICFVLSGLVIAMVYAGARPLWSRIACAALFVIAASTLIVNLPMAAGGGYGLESLATGAVGADPSQGAMMSFIVFATMFWAGNEFFESRIVGSLCIMTIGILSVIGYALNLTALYFQIDDYSYGIAVPTAILLILLGITSLVLTAKIAPPQQIHLTDATREKVDEAERVFKEFFATLRGG